MTLAVGLCFCLINTIVGDNSATQVKILDLRPLDSLASATHMHLVEIKYIEPPPICSPWPTYRRSMPWYEISSTKSSR